jgi:hypothetical protein
MGATGPRFALVAPVATYVRETRPAFTWMALPGARRYRVEVYDDARRLVVRSPEVTATTLGVDRDLDRGGEYLWQVVADDRLSAPAPPAPPARFGVLSAEAVARIDDIGRRYPGSHLLLGLAAAREGALDDARAELALVQKANPNPLPSPGSSLS